MTPPRKTAEAPGASVTRCPMSPPVLDSATASVRLRALRRRTASAAGRALLMLSMPLDAAPDGFLQLNLWLPAKLAAELRGVLLVVVGVENDREARELRAHPAAAREHAPRLDKHAEPIGEPQGEFPFRGPFAGGIGYGGEEALLCHMLVRDYVEDATGGAVIRPPAMQASATSPA